MHSGQIMVVVIVAMVLAARVLRGSPGCGVGFRRFRRWNGDPMIGPSPVDRAENLRLHEEVRVLKDRIAVLERIATDSSTALDREIEALRDRPRP